MSLYRSIKTTWSESFGMQKPLWQIFSTGALGPRWGPRSGSPGATSRGFAKQLCRDIANPYCWTGDHKHWESLERGHKPWRLRTAVSWHLSNLKSAHMKFPWTTWLMRIVGYLSYETCWRFWSASVCWNAFQHWQQYWGSL